jgi:hypothetical protein
LFCSWKLILGVGSPTVKFELFLQKCSFEQFCATIPNFWKFAS